MSKTDLFTNIKMNRNTFTKAEKRIADFVLEHPKDVLYLSITDLAAACGVGDTSVFRFCKTLRLQGYQEFKMHLARSAETAEEEENSENNMALNILNIHIAALNETYSLLNQTDVEKAVDYLLAADRIAFFGVGASYITAAEAQSKFMRIMPNVECTYDSHLQAMQAALLTPDDLAFIISYSGSTKDVIDLARICKKNGVHILCITRFAKSPLKNYADLALTCGSNEGPLQGGSLSAKIAQIYIIDVLYNECFARNHASFKANRDKTSSAILDKMY